MSQPNETSQPAPDVGQVADELVSEWDRRRYVPKAGEPALPPQLAEFTSKSSDQIMTELNRLPFFMTKLDETDGEGGENSELEALKSLAYEGEPHEIATNFKNQGNDCYKAKQYKNAIEYYNKGLDVGCGVKEIESVLYLNRAACNLELKNYRRCIEDCKKCLQLDEKNIKACFRSGKAFFAIEKYEEALSILQYALNINENDVNVQNLIQQIQSKQEQIKQVELKRAQKKQHEEYIATILENSIKLRHFEIIKTSKPAEALVNSKIRLEDEKDYQSQLIFPAMILYPTIDEFDYIDEISELTTPLELLEMILNRPKEWFQDPKHTNFTVKNLQCFMETTSGGLVKVGKKIEINNALMNDKPKAPLFDNALRLYVVPKQDVDGWLAQWNKELALSSRK
ncbi:Hsp70/Hsp90 co-chaperone CNS1 [Spathaspora sp. JA1]|nr:Hsp70/Hsp90 co-chaperone CNS1 [Spathaspora sp. JA1]